ncbi:Uma2 family endonuclease [Oscillatoriales cyanobacterium LEGE 11467]|uniref:Uma2 family endonuclease n=1 Tax=Zarconia navalis LEGE 11467 TaxID=1828826 RepID=A0A928VXC6_9CYAN|nr:Uma2 family endonuclease [Zarconia navalis]MBE9041013.1 Uma2 family endonuclease [Zarconia navalis LEGE 11467]
MTATTPRPTQLSLEAFLAMPETKPASEYINGQIHQKPMPQGEHSLLQTELLAAVNRVSKPQKIAHAFPELRCIFGGRALVPDITVFEWSRIPRKENGRIANRFETYPDWTIEILSPDQSPNQVIRKIVFCLQQGTKLGWFLDPSDESVTVFQPDRLPEFKEKDDLLPVLDILGDWQLSVNELFSWLSLD